MKLAVSFTFSYLLIVAGTGVWMRAVPFMPDAGVAFGHLRHAHSHLAILGWVFSAFLLAISTAFLPRGTFYSPRFQWVFWLAQLSACCMFTAFLAQGYGAVSILLLTLHTLLAYLFFGFFLKKASLSLRQPSTLFIYASIFSFILSSLGPFAIPFVTAFGGGNPVYMKLAVHFYLHFHFSGWFVFALLAVLFKTLENAKIVTSIRLMVWPFWLLVFGLFATYFMYAPLPGLPVWAMAILKVGVVAQWAGAAVYVVAFFRNGPAVAAALKSPFRFLLTFSLTILFLKFTVEMLAVLPAVWALIKTAGTFLTVGWLHLLFLGSITPFLGWFWAQSGGGNWTTPAPYWGAGLFATGFMFSEILLFSAGLGYFAAMLPQGLLAFSALMLCGVVLLAPGIFTKNNMVVSISRPKP